MVAYRRLHQVGPFHSCCPRDWPERQERLAAASPAWLAAYPAAAIQSAPSSIADCPTAPAAAPFERVGQMMACSLWGGQSSQADRCVA